MRTAVNTSRGGRVCITLATLCVATFVSEAQTVTVRVHGGRDAFISDLAAELRASDIWTNDSTAFSAVRGWYASRGFLRVGVDSIIRRSADDVDVWVTEGKPGIVDTLMIQGIPADLAGRIRPRWRTMEGGPFVPTMLEDDIRLTLASLEEQGLLFATVRVSDVRERESDSEFGYTVELVVEPGQVVSIGSIQFEGNAATRSSTLTLASGLRPGSLWTMKAGEQARRRLDRTGLFTSVSIPTVTLTGERKARISFSVVEGRHNSFDGIVGYLPPVSGQGSGSLMGLVQVRFRNLLGTARGLGLRWFQERRGTQEVELAYREPWVAGWPIVAEVGFFQRKQDSTYFRQHVGLDVRGDVSDGMTVGLAISRSTTTPQEGYGKQVLSGSSVTLAGITFAADGRDDAFTPTQGTLFATELHSGRKTTTSATGTTSATERLARFDIATYLQFVLRQVLVLELHGWEVQGGNVDVGDLVRVGGTRTLRGYQEGEFLASRMVRATVEYRLLFSPRSFGSLFLDGGSMVHSGFAAAGLASSNHSRFGYGVGLRIDAPVGLIGLSIAFGQSDSFGDAKLHLQLINEF